MDVISVLVQRALQIAEDKAAELEEVMMVIAKAGVADLLVLEDRIRLGTSRLRTLIVCGNQIVRNQG